MISFLSTKVKSLYKYCAAATGTGSSPKFILDAKVENSVFWKISYWGIFLQLSCLQIQFEEQMSLFKYQNLQKMQNQRVWTQLEIKICFLRQSWTKSWRKIDEVKQNRFLYRMVYSWFFAIFLQKLSKCGFWLDDWVLAIKSKHFRDFLEIY